MENSDATKLHRGITIHEGEVLKHIGQALAALQAIPQVLIKAVGDEEVPEAGALLQAAAGVEQGAARAQAALFAALGAALGRAEVAQKLALLEAEEAAADADPQEAE